MSSEHSVLTSDQQSALDHKLVSLQVQNEHYLREHPELKYLIKNFYIELLEKKPKDPTQFAVSYFTRPPTVLKHVVQKLQQEEGVAPRS